MCHDWWTRREKRRDEEFDRELRYLLDEEGGRSEPATIVEHERAEEPVDPQPIETGSR